MRENKITGIMVYYYFVCKRKLWFHINEISMESENESVQMGKFLDEDSYSSRRKHILINNEINLDFVEKSGLIHEIKKSKKIENASIWQVKYYLYYLKEHGAGNINAQIDYPLLREIVKVSLTDEDCDEMSKILKEIEEIMQSSEMPQIKKSGICKNCAFFDLCMI